MVDRYWRKIESIENNIENAMQISSILLKLKGYDKKLDVLGKITTNEGSISSNLGKITTNEGNISSKLGIINTNKNNISSKLEQITDIKSLLPTSEIFKKTYSIKNQSFKFVKDIIFLNY